MPISKKKIILGIDPGLATTGYGIIEQSGNSLRVIKGGVIISSAKEEFSHRLNKIHQELTRLIKKYKPSVAAIEELFFAKNVKTALKVGQARGVCMLTCQQHKIAIKEFTPLQVKQAITGYGFASKVQIQKMIKLIFKLKKIPRPDDLADALAIAACCAQTKEFK
ncbi:crossover junction endodeoxyribonuclease RuvC [Patescibacteria group bacterium]|nr:crossover junction endodeoxyribonuclease RuvC [Patescibacteria group bacterium]MBU0964462.1 crossover junction endodeoxyribonuclease RuvC [Patescibacteria group bacterium]